MKWMKLSFLVITLSVQSCATSNVSYRSADKPSRKSSKTMKDPYMLPALTESYELSGGESSADDQIRRRGNKARGTNEY